MTSVATTGMLKLCNTAPFVFCATDAAVPRTTIHENQAARVMLPAEALAANLGVIMAMV